MRLSLSCHALQRIFYSCLAELILAGGNHVSLLQYIRGYVDALSVDGEVVVLPMMYLALSYDHRIIDGREAVQFLVP